MILSFIFKIGNWQPRIGDPTLMGWVTVFSYYATALICILCSLFRNSDDKDNNHKIWLFLGLFIGFLGLVKQYNLLSAITEIGRILARRGGWINYRRTVQVVFLLSLFPFMVIGVVKTTKKIIKKRASITLKIALFFTLYLSFFVFLRAISFHPWEEILGFFLFGIKINWLGELIGIYGIFLPGIVNLGRGNS
ncbi:MAG: hypothetical protein N2053_05355 [Chitinispirillaceae bacterium]|nr:hypothetical protein [Chitinispirillaceae bacterium]